MTWGSRKASLYRAHRLERARMISTADGAGTARGGTGPLRSNRWWRKVARKKHSFSATWPFDHFTDDVPNKPTAMLLTRACTALKVSRGWPRR